MRCKLTLTSFSENSVLDSDKVVNIGKIKINSIEWCVPQYTPSIAQQAKLSKQILSETHAELQYAQRSVYKERGKKPKFMDF